VAQGPPIITKQERKAILQQYHLKATDIRLLECIGINATYGVMKEIRAMFPKHRQWKCLILTDDYLAWLAAKEKAPVPADAQRKI